MLYHTNCFDNGTPQMEQGLILIERGDGKNQWTLRHNNAKIQCLAIADLEATYSAFGGIVLS